MYEWMNGWMNEWMDGWMVEWMDGDSVLITKLRRELNNKLKAR